MNVIFFARFQMKFRLPGVIGCIDCTHVAIVKPSHEEHLFFNRKGYHSLNVQMVSGVDFKQGLYHLNSICALAFVHSS